MTKRGELDLTLLGSGFSVRNARASGVSRSRLRADDVMSADWGTRQVVDAGLQGRCSALADRLGDAAVFSHATAARLLHMPLPLELGQSALVHVTVPPPLRAPRGKRIVGHQQPITGAEIWSLDGLQITSPTRTWCDLSPSIALPDLVAAGDWLIFHEHPVGSIEDLTRANAICPSRRGIRNRRTAIGLLSPFAESPAESVLRALVIGAGIPLPQVNENVFDDDGSFIGRVDLTWPSRKVAVEYEGDHHRTDRAQWRRDLARIERLQDAGWRVIRVTAADLQDPARVLAHIRRALS